jgi:hypothetical protein
MQILPLIPEFLVFKCEDRTCLSHSYSGTIIYIHLCSEDVEGVPKDIPKKTNLFRVDNITSPFSPEFFMITVFSDKDEEELDEILKKAAKWYIEYTAFGVFAKENTRLMEERGF